MTNSRVTLAFRLLLGTVFVAAGVAKLLSQVESIDSMMRLNFGGIVPMQIYRLASAGLPWIEIAMGFLFISGFFLRPTAALSIAFTVAFMCTNVIGMLTGNGEECGCFGNIIVLSSDKALAIDVAMLAMAAQILASTFTTRLNAMPAAASEA